MSRWFIRACGLLIVLRAFTNFAKLFQGDDATLVTFGRILHGADTAVPAALIGLFMLATGIALLVGSRWAGQLVAVYAAYVAINLVAWTVTNPGEIERVGHRLSSATDPTTLWWIGAGGFFGYCVVAIATTAGPAWLLFRRRGALVREP